MTHRHSPHDFDRIERCKLCPPPGSGMVYMANGCRHMDLGLQMIRHVGTFHADRVIGLNLERQRLARDVGGRLN